MKRTILALSLALCCGLSASASAQDKEDAEESRAAAFRAVEGAQTEDVPGGSLMVGAYAVALALLVGYVGRLGSLQRSNDRELQRLSAAIAKADKQG